jgi:hypothetical protein
MPDKHPNTERWGGPGASHEDRTEAKPLKKNPEARTDTEVRFSHVSGGGGERDRHHGHSDKSKRDTEENSFQKKQPGD